MSNFTYYAIIGDNATMVSLSWSKSVKCRDTYLRGHRYIKGFNDIDEAIAYGEAKLKERVERFGVEYNLIGYTVEMYYSVPKIINFLRNAPLGEDYVHYIQSNY